MARARASERAVTATGPLVALAIALLLVAPLAAASSVSPTTAAAAESTGAGDSSESAVSPSPSRAVLSATARTEREHDFYSVRCHSHYYELSPGSFASVWMSLNAVLFAACFAVFVRHWCYKAFTSDLAKGY